MCTELQPAPLPVWHDQCKYGLNTSISDLSILVCINTMISDRDQQIRMLFLIQQFRMLFLTQQVELASHGCVRQEIARVKQKSHCYTRMRKVCGETRDHTCQNKRRVVLLRVCGETRDRTCQNRRSYFSEYAVRHEIARVKSQLVLLPEYADNTILHVSGINGVRQQSAGNTTDDAEWMRNDAALFLMG